MNITTSDQQSGERKRHHFVAVTYLKSWASEAGKLYAYRSDGPPDPLHVRPKKIEKINRHTSRFAYRLAFSKDRMHNVLIKRHAATSPVFTARIVRTPKKIEYHIAHKFLERPSLPKFRPENCEDDLYDEDFDL